jgi:hypothetical protein
MPLLVVNASLIYALRPVSLDLISLAHPFQAFWMLELLFLVSSRAI